MNPHRYLILLVIPATVISGYLAGAYYTFLTPFCCFVLLPLLELFSPGKKSSTYNKMSPKSNKAYRFIPFLFVPVVMLLVFAGSIVASLKTLSSVEFLGLMLSVGVANGTIGFTLAHEFIHKHTLPEKTAGYLLLGCSIYLHYSIEHVHGHHVYACTPHDPNSAKKGESFYAFFFRSISGSYKNAWRIESKRLKKNSLSFFSANNRMLLFLFIQLSIVFVLAFVFGINSVLFFVGQGFFAVLLHQQVNYMQHYGLIRKDNAGTIEKMHAHHAWGIPGECKIVDLFQVQNHADHHMHASTPYEKLVGVEESPAFPANYATMMIVSLIPPLWFRIVDMRLPSL